MSAQERLSAEWEAFGQWDSRAALAAVKCKRRHRLGLVWGSTLGPALAIARHRSVMPLPGEDGVMEWLSLPSDRHLAPYEDAPRALALLADLDSQDTHFLACKCLMLGEREMADFAAAMLQRFPPEALHKPQRLPTAIVDSYGALHWRTR